MRYFVSAIFIFFLFLAPCSALEKIDINTASIEELQEIIWVGSVTAQKIINSRPFYSLDDLKKVRGIGQKKLQDIKNQGLAFVNTQNPAPEYKPKSRPKPINISTVPTNSSNTILVISTALILAVFSGAIILILKKKLKIS